MKHAAGHQMLSKYTWAFPHFPASFAVSSGQGEVCKRDRCHSGLGVREKSMLESLALPSAIDT